MHSTRTLTSQRACWDKYDVEREAAARERERAEARDVRAREDLRADLFDVRRERMEDDYYHEQRADGIPRVQCHDDFSPRIWGEVRHELERVERGSDEEETSIEEDAEPLDWAQFAEYMEDQGFEYDEYAEYYEKLHEDLLVDDEASAATYDSQEEHGDERDDDVEESEK